MSEMTGDPATWPEDPETREEVDAWLAATALRWENAVKVKPPDWDALEGIPPMSMSFHRFFAEMRRRITVKP